MFHFYGKRGCGGQAPHSYYAVWGHMARGGFGRGMRGRGDGGGRRRMFDGSELRLILLALIADEPRHGYDLIKLIEERTGGAYAPSPGVVYPTLTLLADMGLIEERASEGAKKLFAVTDAGTTHLDENAVVVTALMGRLAAMAVMREQTDSASIRRAMGNLREVLQNRLGGDDITPDKLHAVTALIDEAAQKIERL